MTNRFRVSSTLPRRLQELGLSPEAVLRQAGLPMGLFKQEKILVSTEELFALHRGIAEASNDPGFGLKLGSLERVEHYDPTQITALSARSFRDAVGRFGAARGLTMPVLSIGGDKSPGEALGAQMKLVATDVTVVIVKNSGHWILEEQPKQTTDALVKFL